jgi:hypothetical protein
VHLILPLISVFLAPEHPTLAGLGRDRPSLYPCSANFAFWAFCELPLYGVLGSAALGGSQKLGVLQGIHTPDPTSLPTLTSTSDAGALSSLMVRNSPERCSLRPAAVASGIVSS